MHSPDESTPKALKISQRDNVGTLISDVSAGQQVDILLSDEPVALITAQEPICTAHKIALCKINKGEAILKYGECIGQATLDIPTGFHVHVHNIKSLRGKSSHE